MSRSRLLPCSAIACLAACAAPLPRGAPEFEALAAVQARNFPGADRLLSGFAPPDDDPELRVGDAALFALEFTRNDAVERQLLLLEVTELATGRIESGSAMVKVPLTTTVTLRTTSSEGTSQRRLQVSDIEVALRRCDAEGRELASSRATLYAESLCAGWWPDADPDASQQEHDLATLLLLSLQNLANSEPTIRDLLFLAVDAPSLLSIATHLGVNVTVETGRARSGEAPAIDLPAAGGAEIRLLPNDLHINGAQALFADLLVVRPRGAMMVATGLVGAVARHPSEAGRGAAVKLLATRRGSD